MGPGHGHFLSGSASTDERLEPKWMGACPQEPYWVGCECESDQTWQSCGQTAADWSSWWCDLGYWWSIFWC